MCRRLAPVASYGTDGGAAEADQPLAMLQFLAPDWFTAVSVLLADVQLSSVSSCQIQFDTTAGTWDANIPADSLKLECSPLGELR